MTISTPFKKLRLCIAFLFILTSLILMSGVISRSVVMPAGVIHAVLVAIVGVLFIGLEHRVTIDPAQWQLNASWFLFSHQVGKIRTANLKGADRIKIHKRPVVDYPFSRRLYRQDFLFPVYVMSKGAVMTYVTGWPEEKPNRRFHLDTTALTNSAHFPSYSQWVAAHVAKTLGLPLEDGRTSIVYEPGQIPKEWFDPSTIRMTISWARC